MGIDIAFWVLAVVSVVSALTVVLLKNIFHAALTLVLCFLAVAGIYITLSADFLALVQILIYVGGISILIILAVMLTREVQQGNQSNRLRIPALIVTAALAVVMIIAVAHTPWMISGQAPLTPTTAALSTKLLGDGGYILALEIGGTLLLAAILGAIVLVKEK